MRKLKILMSLIAVLALASCKGDRGPQGPSGGSVLGKVFEVKVDFTPQNNYNHTFKFPKGVVVYESDVLLVYLLEEVTGNDVDVWTPLPQTYFDKNLGTMIYSFNHSFLDVKLFLDADFPLNQLSPQFTKDQVFRIAIVPMEFAEEGLSMDELMESGRIEWIN